MKENTQDKILVKVDENSIFYKIKRFFRNLFHKSNIIEKNIDIQEIRKNEEQRTSFIETVKNIENEKTKILKLQKQYRSGEIKEENLTEEQINSLCILYDRQIANLRKFNETRKQRLLEYRRKL